MPRYAVFSGSLYAARDWARENAVPDSEWFFVDHPRALYGLTAGNAVPVLTHGFWGRHDAFAVNAACVERFGTGPRIVRLADGPEGTLPGSKRCRWCAGEILPVTMCGVTAWVHRGVDAARWDRQSCMPGRRAVPELEEADDAEG